MSEDTYSTNSGVDEVEFDSPAEISGWMKINRRQLVLGATATTFALTAYSALADEDGRLKIGFVRDPERSNRFGILFSQKISGSPDQKVAFFPDNFFSQIKSPIGRKAGQKVDAGQPSFDNLRGLRIDNIQLSDRRDFSLALIMDESKLVPSIKIVLQLRRNSVVESINSIPLSQFLNGEISAPIELTIEQAEDLRWDLFGDRIQFKGKTGATLFFKLIRPPELKRSDSVWEEVSFQLELVPKAGTLLSAFEGAVHLPDGLLIRRVASDVGEGAQIQLEQQVAAQMEPQPVAESRKKRLRSVGQLGPALIAEARVAPTEEAGVPPPGKTARIDWVGQATGPKGVRTKAYFIGESRLPRKRIAVRVQAVDKPTSFTLRQWGIAQDTLAILRGAFEAAVLAPSPEQKGASPLPAAEFLLQEGLLTQQASRPVTGATGPAAIARGTAQASVRREVDETLIGRLQEKAFTIETPIGPMIVEGDPPPQTLEQRRDSAQDTAKNAGVTVNEKAFKPVTGNPLGVPLDRRNEFTSRPAKGLTQFFLKARNDEITFFDARAILRQIAVNLPNTANQEHLVSEVGNVWSRFDFSGVEIAFRLNLSGKENVWPSARGVVTLGSVAGDLSKLASNGLEAGVYKPGQAIIALDGAKLRVRRDSDNLALTFQFRNMALEIGGGKVRIVPNLRLSGAGAGSVRSEVPGEANVRFDDRPLLIVEFPPQHVAEKVYYRQTNDGIILPEVISALDLATSSSFREELKKWRKEKVPAQKLKKRKDMFERELKNSSLNIPQDRVELIKDFYNIFDGKDELTAWENAVPRPNKSGIPERWRRLPEDQRRYYLGTSSEAMDPDARQIWLDLWREYQNAMRPVREPGVQAAAFRNLLNRAPDLELPLNFLSDIKKHFEDPSLKLSTNDQAVKIKELIRREKKKRSADFIVFARLYEGLPEDFQKSPQRIDKQLEHANKLKKQRRDLKLPDEYDGHDALLNAWLNGSDADKTNIHSYVANRVEEFEKELSEDPFRPVTPARLSGISRLVFRFDAAGGSFDAKEISERSDKTEDLEEVRSIDFTLQGLTDWGRFDLAVTRRAETLEVMPGGRVPHPDMRAVDLDTSRILAHQGIRPGQTIEGRLADIEASLKAPSLTETAIELPFRLQLSPDQFGRFRTRRQIACEVLTGALSSSFFSGISPVLWSANLQIGAVQPRVRAIWSDDFVPSALTAGAMPPVRGPAAPWDRTARAQGRRNDFLTALDAYDRHEICALSSVYGLPSMGRYSASGQRDDPGQFEPPQDYRLQGLKLYEAAPGAVPSDMSSIYNPAPLSLSELRLTAFGGSLRHDSAFLPPASARRQDGTNIFEALSVERWRQYTVLGRDIEVEVVYKGYLFPLGIRAALVKLTERRFMRNETNGVVTAFLIQRKFIRIGKPDKTFPAMGQPNSSRRFPVHQLTMLTRETPDIVDPDIEVTDLSWLDIQHDGRLKEVSLRPNGAVDFRVDKDARPDAALCFWPRTKPGPEGNILFEFRLDADAAPLRMPLVFVDNRGANNRDVLQALTKYYNADENTKIGALNKPLRMIKMGGAPRRYAEENKDGECEFETFKWEIRAEGRAETRVTAAGGADADKNTNFELDPFLQGAEQPPFYPYVHQANLRIGQAERFVGRALEPVDVEYVNDFTNGGFPDANDGYDRGNESKLRYLERYLVLLKSLKLDMADSGDRSGGIGRPSMDIKFLSRRFGLMPKEDIFPTKESSPPTKNTTEVLPPEPPSPPFNLTEFFAGDAKLLGIITFKELIEIAIAEAGSALPELKERVDAASDETAGFLRQKVLPEIEESLKSLERMWDNAQKTLTSQADKSRGVASLDIDKIYPEIAPALKELVLRVSQAKEAREIADVVSAMSKVQTSGRKFVTALNRTLADPVTPLREELRSKFRAVSGLIHAFGEGFGAVVDQLVREAKKEARKLAEEAFLKNVNVRPFLALIVALPVPDGIIGKTLSNEVVAELEDVLVAGGRAFVKEILAASRIDEAVTLSALERALRDAKNELNDKVLAAVGQTKITLEEYQTKARELVELLDDGATKEKALERIRREVPGLLQPLFFAPESGLLPDIKRQIDNIENSIKDGGRDVLERIGRDLGILLQTTAKAFVVQKAQNACKDQLGAFFALVKARLPAAAAPTPGAPATPISRKPIETILAKINVFVPASIKGTPQFKSNIELLEDAGVQLERAWEELQNLKSEDVCQMLLALPIGAAPTSSFTVPNQTLKRVFEQLRYVRVDFYEALRTLLPQVEEHYSGLSEQVLSQIFTNRIHGAFADAFAEIESFAGAADTKFDAAFGVLDKTLEESKQSATIPILKNQITELQMVLGSIRTELKIFNEGLKTAATAAKASWDVSKPVESAKRSLEAVRMMILVLDGYRDIPVLDDRGKRFKAAFEELNSELKRSTNLELRRIEESIKHGLAKQIDEIEKNIASVLAFIVSTEDRFKIRIIRSLAITLAPFFKFLEDVIYKEVWNVREKGQTEIEGNTASAGLIQYFLKLLKGPGNKPLTSVFTIEPKVDGKDQLDLERERVKRLAMADTTQYFDDITILAEGWRKGQSAPELLVRNVSHVLTAVLKGDLAQFVDLQHIRREIDAAIRMMVPARIEQSYDLKLQLRDIGDLVLFGTNKDSTKKQVLDKLGLPEGHPKGLPEQLVLRARGVIDLLQPNKSSFEAEGYMPAFAVQLLPAFDVATIGFPPTMFSAGPGKPFNISLKVRNVELGEKVSFIKDLQSILPAPKDGSGFYIKLMTGRSGIGIVAGYALPMGSITIGNMFIDNLALNVAVELPFTDGDARFLLSISRPEAPFMIAVAPYAGAGHFGLIANPRGIIGFEASFQYGGGGGFSFGPLKGTGRISVGVYVRQMQGLTDLYGVFYAGGSARIACFGVGAQLNVRMGQTAGGDVEGDAIFTYSFSVGVKDIEFSVTVYKKESGSKGASGKSKTAQQSGNIIDLASDEFRELSAFQPQFAQLNHEIKTGSARSTASLHNITRCRADNFRIYKTYFARAEAMRPRVKSDFNSSKVWVML